MLQLIINGIVADLPSDPKVAITYEANNIGNLADRNGSFANTFDLPLTGNNRNIFGLSDQIGSAFDTGATLPVQAFYTNWLIFEGVCRVVRYFGNNLQVELIGGVGTLVEAIGVKTLGDFEYHGLPDMQIGEDYNTPSVSNDVMVCRMDGGTWGLRKDIPVGGASRYMFIYNEEAIYWYRLSKVMAGIADGLGVTIALPDDFDNYYLAQGSFGKNPLKIEKTGTGGCAKLNITAGPGGYGFAILPVQINTNNDYFNSTLDNIFSTNGAYVRITWEFEFVYEVFFPISPPSGIVSASQVMQEAFIGDSLVASNITSFTSAVGFNAAEGTFSFDVNLSQYAAMQSAGLRFNLRVAARSTLGGFTYTYKITTDPVNRFKITPYDRQCQNTIVTPKQAMPKVTVSDFFLDICQRFGYTISYDGRTNQLAFVKQSNLDNRTLAVDWNGKVESPLDSQFGTQYQTEFVYGSYARNNRYASEDGQDFAILEANVDTPIDAEAYTSIANTPTLSTYGGDPYSIGQWTDGGDQMRWPIVGWPYVTGNVLGFVGNFWEATENVTLSSTVVPGSYTVVTDNNNGFSVTTPWKYVTLSDVFSYTDKLNIGHRVDATFIETYFQSTGGGYGFSGQSLYWMDNAGLSWQSALDTRYQWLSAILSNPRIHKVLVRIRPTDLPLSFDKPIYWNQAYWYLVSVQDFNPMTGENTVCVLAQIPDYPTR